MSCPTENDLLAYVEGRAARPAREALAAHLAGCDECRALVSLLAKTSMAGPAPAGASLELGATAPATDLAPPSDPVPRPGDLLAGKYRVERVLGAGGMGIVVAAHHEHLRERVAIKLMRREACKIHGSVERFLREARSCVKVKSENVVRVLDTGTLPSGEPFMVMEHLAGQDLAEVLQARGPLPADVAVEYVVQACEAICEAHALGIVHRDLKPANLFLTRRADGTPLVKVLDFGISKSALSGPDSAVTSENALLGSPRYMSPEQMQSTRDVDARTDVWALGVVLHELVTGRPPFEADTTAGLCAAIMTATPPPIRALRPDLPEALERVIVRCLTKSRDGRYASIGELVAALDPLVPASARVHADRVARLSALGRPASLPPGAGSAAPPSAEPRPTPISAAPASAAPPSAEPRGAARPAARASGSRTVVLALASVVAGVLATGAVLLVVSRRHADDAPGASASSGAEPPRSAAAAAAPSPPASAVAAPVAIAPVAAPESANAATPPPRPPASGGRPPQGARATVSAPNATSAAPATPSVAAARPSVVAPPASANAAGGMSDRK